VDRSTGSPVGWAAALCKDLAGTSKCIGLKQGILAAQEVMLRMQEIAHEVRSFVMENFRFGEGDGHFSNDDSFFENGLVDSIGVIHSTGL